MVLNDVIHPHNRKGKIGILVLYRGYVAVDGDSIRFKVWAASRRKTSYYRADRWPTVTLRVQVPSNHILTQNLYYNYHYPKPKYPIIVYLDPLGYCISLTIYVPRLPVQYAFRVRPVQVVMSLCLKARFLSPRYPRKKISFLHACKGSHTPKSIKYPKH